MNGQLTTEKMMTTYKNLLRIFALMLLVACEGGFFGYKYDADRLADTARIEGVLIDNRDGFPVDTAEVILDFAGQEVVSNTGIFQLDYLLSADEGANRPVDITVRSSKFEPVDTSIIVFPDTNRLDLTLTFGAPEVVASIGERPSQYLIADVHDPQGEADIAEVMWSGNYFVIEEPDEPAVKRRFSFPMQRLETLDQFTARYEINTPILPNADRSNTTYFVRATDRGGLNCEQIFWFFIGDSTDEKPANIPDVIDISDSR